MAYMTAIGPCLCCKRIFAYNPNTVPSSSAVTGSREPVCQSCMQTINQNRVKNGLQPFPIASDAYEPEEVP
jgi:hypothetical protein